MRIIITGGCGFIGSALIRFILDNTENEVINIDKMTYAANPINLSNYENHKNYSFLNNDICDSHEVKRVFNEYKPNGIIHLAAESHVDRSIDSPAEFINTNIFGTFTLLNTAREFHLNHPSDFKLFHHVSTDEVYGDLGVSNDFFREDTPYDPHSPYSSSKASSDHLVRAWNRTYGLPTVITNCSNNYGPYQSPEKLIPMMIMNAINKKELPVYGNGMQVRDWLYVDDHVKAIYTVFMSQKTNQTFNIGGGEQKTNLDVVNTICHYLDKNISDKPDQIKSFSQLIRFVEDRPGHDEKYAIDYSKISRELNWKPSESFDSGIQKTISWYIDNMEQYQPNIDIITKRRGLNR